jgi:stage III sporulation protein AB
MLKILLGLAVVLVSTAFGYIASNKYRQRRRFLGQFREFNDRFINEITYYRRPIKEFLASNTFDGLFQALLQEYVQRLEDFTEANAVFNLSDYSFLSENEKNDLLGYFNMLGKGDSLSQKAYFFSMRERLVQYETESVLQGKKYENLYLELGFLCGLFILILII